MKTLRTFIWAFAALFVASYGAAAGLLAARGAARRQKAEASAQIEHQNQRSQAVTAEQIEGFKKAFTACLEAKDYVAKF